MRTRDGVELAGEGRGWQGLSCGGRGSFGGEVLCFAFSIKTLQRKSDADRDGQRAGGGCKENSVGDAADGTRGLVLAGGGWANVL